MTVYFYRQRSGEKQPSLTQEDRRENVTSYERGVKCVHPPISKATQFKIIYICALLHLYLSDYTECTLLRSPYIHLQTYIYKINL